MSRSSRPTSVVIPAYNAQQFIAEAIHSVLAQTHRDLELIVIDDGSTDDTAAIARALLDERSRVLSGPNLGLAGARNRGMRCANGQTIAFLDADDCWDERKLEVQLELMTDQPDAIAVGCLMRYISASGKSLGVAGHLLSDEGRSQLGKAQLMPFPISSILFQRPLLVSVGGFDETLAKDIPGLVEDIDLLSKLSSLGRIECVPEILGSYRIHKGAASASFLASQRTGRRFIEARRLAEHSGASLSWKEFSAGYRPSFTDRRLDAAAAAYRAAGLAVAESRWMSAIRSGLIALIFGPGYTLRRLRRHGPWRMFRNGN